MHPCIPAFSYLQTFTPVLHFRLEPSKCERRRAYIPTQRSPIPEQFVVIVMLTSSDCHRLTKWTKKILFSHLHTSTWGKSQMSTHTEEAFWNGTLTDIRVQPFRREKIITRANSICVNPHPLLSIGLTLHSAFLFECTKVRKVTLQIALSEPSKWFKADGSSNNGVHACTTVMYERVRVGNSDLHLQQTVCKRRSNLLLFYVSHYKDSNFTSTGKIHLQTCHHRCPGSISASGAQLLVEDLCSWRASVCAAPLPMNLCCHWSPRWLRHSSYTPQLEGWTKCRRTLVCLWGFLIADVPSSYRPSYGLLASPRCLFAVLLQTSAEKSTCLTFKQSVKRGMSSRMNSPLLSNFCFQNAYVGSRNKKKTPERMADLKRLREERKN